MDFRTRMEVAIRTGFDNYVNFEGRAARWQYWHWVIFAVAVGVAVSVLDGIFGTGSLLVVLVSLALLLPGLSYAARRMHDTGRSGWWVLVVLIPFVGWIVLAVLAAQPGQPGANAWGEAPA